MPAEFDLERLYDDHAQALFGYLSNLTQNRQDTHDALQEVFVKLAHQPQMLRGIQNPRGFLVRLAHHAAVDLMRRRGTRDKYHEQFGAEKSSLFAPSDDPDTEAFRIELSN